LSYLNEAEPTLEAAHLYRLGAWVYFGQGKYHEASEWFQKSLALASSIHTREAQQVMAEVYNYLGAVYGRWGDLARSEQFCLQCLQIYQQLGDIAGQSRAYHNLGTNYHSQGNWLQASEAWRKSLAIKKEIGDIFEQNYLTGNLAMLHTDRGEWDQALDLFEQSLTISRQIGALAQEGLVLSNLAQLHLYRGNWAEARANLSRSQAIFVEAGSGEFLPEVERRWGELCLKTGELDQALAHLHTSLDLAAAQGNTLEEGMSYRVLGQIYLGRAELQAAETALRQSLGILIPLNTYEAAKTELALAHLALASGLPAEAHTHLTLARHTFATLGAQADLREAQTLEEQLTSLMTNH
jgi:tetratricopeptide (TPR) repeat protein